MTEEIIIDGAFYKDGVCASPINKTCEYCKNIDVSKCYHKQLKSLEQENEKLKKEVKQIGSDFIKKGDYARELEQENKELKEMLSKEPKAMQAFQIAYSGLKKENEVLWGMVEDYKSALEAIRIMATKDVSIESFLKIQNKINEVLR